MTELAIKFIKQDCDVFGRTLGLKVIINKNTSIVNN